MKSWIVGLICFVSVSGLGCDNGGESSTGDAGNGDADTDTDTDADTDTDTDADTDSDTDTDGDLDGEKKIRGQACSVVTYRAIKTTL